MNTKGIWFELRAQDPQVDPKEIGRARFTEIENKEMYLNAASYFYDWAVKEIKRRREETRREEATLVINPL